MKQVKILKSVLGAFLLAALVSACGEKSKNIDTSEKPIANPPIAEQTVPEDTVAVIDNTKDIDLINSVYTKYVFGNEEINNPEKFFTAHALKKLQADYEYDCYEGNCYAFWALRTGAQDSKPGTNEKSEIFSIEPSDEGLYVVSYSDMGWNGKTRIKIKDGKIDDYKSLSNDVN